MRRYVFLVLIALLVTAALVSAQEQEPPPEPVEEETITPNANMHMVNGAWQPLNLEPAEDPDGPLAITAVSPSDFCDLAPNFNMRDGWQGNARNFTFQGDDPVLSCLWGSPPRIQGNRTAWYKFTPNFNGPVVLTTQGSKYDTVLAVYSGLCGSLTELACSDDGNYFTSRIDMSVQAGKEYYIEIADWQEGANDEVTLVIASIPQPFDSKWEVTSAGSDTKSFRSRHVVVRDGNGLYIIGGQTAVGDNPSRTPSGYLLDTANGNTDVLPPMSSECGDGRGYSNTTAVNINGKIYFPAGYIGNDNVYHGTHCVFDTVSRVWSGNLAAPNDWEAGTPAIYSQANAYTFPGALGTGYFLSGGLTGPFPDPDTTVGWQAQPELDFYSVNANSWTRLDSMSFGRFGHVAAVQSIAGRAHLCVAGGFGKNDETSQREVLDSTYCYDVNDGNWVTSPFAPLNYGRYFASSAVDPQGNWYVFGGFNESDIPVPFTERYDRATDRWIVMDAGYNVGVNPLDPQANVRPPRAWSRGAFVGNTLWIVGGETVNHQVLNFVQRADFYNYPASQFLPILGLAGANESRNNTFATAAILPFGASVQDRFYTPDDYVNIYSVEVPSRQLVEFELVHLGSGNWLDLTVYTKNKGFVIEGNQPGTNPEQLAITLSAGRYFVVVQRVFPPPGDSPASSQYQLRVGPG